MNVNKAIIIGRLTRDPELRTTPSGQSVTNFSLATSSSWKGQDGQQQERTEFHNIVAWGRRGEVIHQYCKKGQELFIEGRLETRSWDDQASGKKMYRTEIIMDNFEFGARAGEYKGNTSNNQQSTPQQNNPQPVAEPKQEDEIPTINLDDEQEEIKLEDVPF